MTGMRWLLRLSVFALLAAVAVISFLFVQFVVDVQNYSRSEPPARAEAIVVLTGDSGRIARAVDLLRSGGGERLLISGVNIRTTREAIREMIGDAGYSFDCCVDFDRAALDTVGNARQAHLWARQYGYKSLLLVTSDYHLPRSLIEFARQMPEIEIIPVPVPSSPSRSALTDPNMFRRIAPEFLKFLAARFQLGYRSIAAPKTDALLG